jgi:hypothetical protein
MNSAATSALARHAAIDVHKYSAAFEFRQGHANALTCIVMVMELIHGSINATCIP